MHACDELKQCQKHLKNIAVDLIILNAIGNSENCIKLCSKLCMPNNKSKPRPIILLCDKDSLDQKLEFFNSGAKDIIVEPFTDNELLARIETNIRISKLSQHLEHSEKRYRDLVEHSPDLIMLFSATGKLLYSNNRTHKTLPAQLRDLTLGQSINKNTKFDSIYQILWNLIEKANTKKSILSKNISVKTSAKEECHLEIRAIASDLPENEQPAVQVLIRDVTEKYRMEKVISRAEKINSLGILAAGISHEINNPLAGISNAIQILKKNDLPASKKREITDLIMDNIDRITRIIDDLHYFYRQEKSDTNKFDPIKAISKTLNLLKYQKDFHKVRLEFNHDKVSCLITGSENQFQQLLINLLINAFQAISQNGLLQIDFACKTNHEPLAEIRISDNGCGIQEELLEQIFDPFFTTKNDWKGTGMGLAVSYRIVQLLKGSISIDSKPDEGTIVTLVFPVDSNSQEKTR